MRIIHLYILAFLSTFIASAQHVVVECPTQVGLNEQFRLRYVVENASIDDITFPSLSDFTPLSSPQHSSSYGAYSNGLKMTTTSKEAYTLLLMPKEKGTFTIPPAQLVIDGKKVKSKAVKVHVIDDGKQPAITRITGDDIFVRAVVSKRKVLEQEALTLKYRLFWKPGINLSVGATQCTPPDFQALTSVQITTSSPQLGVERIGGQLFKVIDYLEYVIFPQQAGTLTLPSVTIKCPIIELDPSLDPQTAFFNNRMRQQVVDCTSAPLTVEVAPLPRPQPADFIGLVGTATLRGAWTTSEIRAGEPAHYQLTISGHGNLNLMLPPRMHETDSLEVYDTATQEDLQISQPQNLPTSEPQNLRTSEPQNLTGYSGSVTYDYTLLPKHAGAQTMPPLTASFFNPLTQRYEQLSTGPISLHVLPALPASAPQSNHYALHPVHAGHHQAVPASDYITWGSIAYGLKYLFIALTGGIIYVIIKRFRSRDKASKLKNKALYKASLLLESAQQCIKANDSAAFHAKIHEAIMLYLEIKFNLKRAEQGRAHIHSLLTAHGAEEATTRQLLRIIDTCEYAKFAPPSASGILSQLLNETSETLRRIDIDAK